MADVGALVIHAWIDGCRKPRLVDVCTHVRQKLSFNDINLIADLESECIQKGPIPWHPSIYIRSRNDIDEAAKQ